MNAGDQTLGGGDPFEQAVELGPFIGLEPGADLLFVGGAEGGHIPEQELATGLGQVEGVLPPIFGVAATLDQAPFFQRVDQQHESGGGRPQLGGHRLLALSRLPGDQSQQPGLCRRQPDGLDPLGETPGRVGADLGQEERVLGLGW